MFTNPYTVDYTQILINHGWELHAECLEYVPSLYRAIYYCVYAITTVDHYLEYFVCQKLYIVLVQKSNLEPVVQDARVMPLIQS